MFLRQLPGTNPTEVSGARWIRFVLASLLFERREARQFSSFLAETRVVNVCQKTTRSQITGKAVGINGEVTQSLQRQFVMARTDMVCCAQVPRPGCRG